MPPSDRATFSFGKRSGTPDHSHSPAASSALTGKKVGRISKGGSGEGRGAQADDPVCRQTTVSVSSQAAKKGSHCPLKMDGRPSWAGNSGKLTALKPRAALARTSAAATRDVLQPRQLQGDDALGMRTRPLLEVPVVEGAQAGQTELGVLGPRVDGAAEARDQRREAEGGPDPGPVHVLDASLDVEAARTHLVEAGRLHAPLVAGAPDHGVEADVGVAVALEDPRLASRRPARPPGARPRPGRRAVVPRKGRAAR